MRICLVSHSFYPATFYGGPISATWDLSKKLADNDIKVFVSTTNANGNKKLDVLANKFIRKQKNLFIKYYNEQIINRFSFSFFLGIWSDIKKSDVVYIQYLFHYTVFFALTFSVILNKKIIVCPRGSFSDFTLTNNLVTIKYLWLSLFIGPIIRKITWHASSYIEKEDVLRRFPVAEVRVVNDGVNYLSFQNNSEITRDDILKQFTRKDFFQVSHLFFSMGRLHHIKCFNVLIDAFSLFEKNNGNAKLLIAGADDGAQESLFLQIKDLNLLDSVFLIGPINFEEKKLLLSNCDVFALASEFESFGIVVAEALACGAPVVVSNKTPWKDLEINNYGILADNDKNSFYDAFRKIVRVNHDKDRIKKYVKENFDWDSIVERFINLIRNK
tara:strand:- start:63 stop:1220 length:1158 start_codon:yes stop_codon:yes gene_type:complete